MPTLRNDSETYMNRCSQQLVCDIESTRKKHHLLAMIKVGLFLLLFDCSKFPNYLIYAFI